MTLACALTAATHAHAQGLTENLRAQLDVGIRGIDNDLTDKTSSMQFVGLDLQKVFTGANGDWGVLNLQPYMQRFSGDANPRQNTTKLIYRIFNFNYTGLSRGGLNVRVGHFIIPFGLESTMNVIGNNGGSLRDEFMPQRFAIKADWGVSLNGILPLFEYEVALMRGSGNSFKSGDDPYIVSGRISTPQNRNLVLGLSFFDGNSYSGGQRARKTERRRYGVDLQYYFRRFGFLADLSIGDNEDLSNWDAVTEINWQTDYDSWLLFVQYRRYEQELANSTWAGEDTFRAGLRFEPNNVLQLELLVSEQSSRVPDGRDVGVLAAQFRVRFGN